MSNTALITFPSAGDKTLALFLEAQAKELGDAHGAILSDIVRAVTESGVVQPVDAMLQKLVGQGGLGADQLRAAIADLVHRRLLELDDSGQRIIGFLGSLSLVQTPHRARLESGIDVYTHGGIELLAVSSTLLKPVEVFSACPVTGQELRLRIADEQIQEAHPTGISGFIAEWDGVEPLAAMAARSPLFASDEAVEKWLAARPGIKGTELPGDLLLWVGMEAAKQLGALRFKLIGHHR